MTHHIMTDENIKLTVRSLDNKLRDLVNWKRFALYLPGIKQSDIELIVAEKRDDIVEQRLQLFGRWLSLYPNASWQNVVAALEKADELKIAHELKTTFKLSCIPVLPNHQSDDHSKRREVEVTEDIVKDLDKLNSTFQALTIKSQRAVENEECSLDDLLMYIEQQRAYKLTGLQSVNTSRQFFGIIKPHYTFLNCYLLVNMVLSLLPSVSESAKNYRVEVEQFKQTTKVKSLHKTLKRFFDDSMSNDTVKVTILLQNVWGECNMWLVEVLVQTLFRLKSPDECRWFRVLPGSLCLVFLAHEDLLQALIDNSKQMIQFMKLMGVISLEVGTILLPIKGGDNYSFEKSLLQAAKKGNTEAVTFLIKHLNVDINVQSTEEPTTLLVEEDDTCHTPDNETFYSKWDSCFTALMIASYNNDTTMMKLLLEYGANPNIQSNLGYTALTYSCLFGSLKSTNILLEYDAEIDLTKYHSGGNDSSAFHSTSSVGYTEVFAMLLEINLYFNPIKGVTPLYVACEKGYINVLERLLKEKADPNAPIATGATPLYVASQNGHLKIVERLLEAEANPDTPCNTGETPLFIACQNGHLKIVERLLEARVRLNIQCDTGETPLFIASQNGHIEIVQRLLDQQANPNILCNDKTSPLFVACQDGFLEIVDMLLKAKANPNIPRETGATPIYIASQEGHLEVVKRLLKTNLNFSTETKSGATPLMVASYNGHFEIVRLLSAKFI